MRNKDNIDTPMDLIEKLIAGYVAPVSETEAVQ